LRLKEKGDLEQGKGRQGRPGRRRWSFCQSRTVAEAAWGSRDAHVQSRRHASIRPAGGWGPRRSALAPCLRHEAKPERALGPGATVGVLGTRLPRLACLRPRVWPTQRSGTAHLQHQHSRPSRGAEPREADSARTSWGSSSPGLAPEERRYLCNPHLVRFR
jgi:hypothetical protein